MSNVISSARRVATGMVDLVVLEGRRAGLALAWMLGLGVAAAILGVTAWLGLMAVAALGTAIWMRRRPQASARLSGSAGAPRAKLPEPNSRGF